MAPTLTVLLQTAIGKIGTLSRTRLEGEDAARFFAVLDRKPESNQVKKELMVGY